MTRVQVTYGRGDAHALVRETVAAYAAVTPDRVVLTHECPRCGGDDHGRPRIVPVPALRHPPYVSLARAGDVCAVAVTDTGEVGIDIERSGAGAGLGLSDGDQTLTWVRTEALLKASGLGLRVDPRHVRLGRTDRPPALTGWRSPYPRPDPVWMTDLDLPGHVAALAVLTHLTRLVVDGPGSDPSITKPPG